MMKTVQTLKAGHTVYKKINTLEQQKQWTRIHVCVDCVNGCNIYKATRTHKHADFCKTKCKYKLWSHHIM